MTAGANPDESTASWIAEIEKRLDLYDNGDMVDSKFLQWASGDIAFLLKLAHPSPGPDGWIATGKITKEDVDFIKSMCFQGPDMTERQERRVRRVIDELRLIAAALPTPPVREQP